MYVQGKKVEKGFSKKKFIHFISHFKSFTTDIFLSSVFNFISFIQTQFCLSAAVLEIYNAAISLRFFYVQNLIYILVDIR